MLPSPLYLPLLARQAQFNWNANIYQVWYGSSDQNHLQWKVSKSPAYSKSTWWRSYERPGLCFQEEGAQTTFRDPSLMTPKRSKDHGPCCWGTTPGRTQELGQLQKYIFCKYISKGNKLSVLTLLLGCNCWRWWKEDTVAAACDPV